MPMFRETIVGQVCLTDRVSCCTTLKVPHICNGTINHRIEVYKSFRESAVGLGLVSQYSRSRVEDDAPFAVRCQDRAPRAEVEG